MAYKDPTEYGFGQMGSIHVRGNAEAVSANIAGSADGTPAGNVTADQRAKSATLPDKEGTKTKLIRFGQQGVTTAGKKTDKKSKARRKSFKARHAKNIKKGKMSAAYWANKVKW